MIKLFFFPVQEGARERLLCLIPDEATREYIIATKNTALADERASAYALLFSLLKLTVGLTDAVIDRTADKPRLKLTSDSLEGEGGARVRASQFNISHTEGMVAVAISDEYESIGIDIERQMSQKRAERILSRYRGLDTSVSYDGGISLYFVEICDTSGDLTFKNASDMLSRKLSREKGQSPECAATELWVRMESLLKADGGGFKSSSSLDSLSETVSVYSGVLEYSGVDYYFALAVKYK